MPPETSVTTRDWPVTRTTRDPSVFATSDSSTSASWVFVPVPLLPTAPAVSSDADASERSANIGTTGPPPKP